MRLTCCVCGEVAVATRHWYNRDAGFGLCGRCAEWLKSRPDYNPVEFDRNYGQESIHWFATV